MDTIFLYFFNLFTNLWNIYILKEKENIPVAKCIVYGVIVVNRDEKRIKETLGAVIGCCHSCRTCQLRILVVVSRVINKIKKNT